MSSLSELGQKDRFRVILLEEDRPPEVVYETESPRQARIWVGEWLKEHLGIPVGVIPPSHLRQKIDREPS